MSWLDIILIIISVWLATLLLFLTIVALSVYAKNKRNRDALDNVRQFPKKKCGKCGEELRRHPAKTRFIGCDDPTQSPVVQPRLGKFTIQKNPLDGEYEARSTRYQGLVGLGKTFKAAKADLEFEIDMARQFCRSSVLCACPICRDENLAG